MKRTKNKSIVLPDAINCSPAKNFVQMPKEILRNPELSAKAKTIIGILLSNKEGWKSHATAIKNFMKEGLDAISTGLKELEGAGYLIRLKYRTKETKKWVGGFWAYTDTPNQFNIKEQLQYLDKNGLEVGNLRNKPERDFPDVGLPDVGLPDVGNPVLIIYNNNNTNINNTKSSSDAVKNGTDKNKIKLSQFEKFRDLYPAARRGSKGAALTSWTKICKTKEAPTWQEVRRALKDQIKSEQWQEEKFIPHLTTWLNQKRWLDKGEDLKAPRKDSKLSNAHKNKTKGNYSW